MKSFESNKIDFIHLDVMDGHFVDNLSFGPSAASAIKSKFKFKIDSHLMVDNPVKMIPKFIKAGSDWISFHVETVKNKEIPGTIGLIKDQNLSAGLVLNPDTPVERVFPYLDKIDFVLLMSVFPGYGGQSFIPSTIERTATLKQEIEKQGSRSLIQVDGGINTSNIESVKKAGADLFVVGTFLFNSDNIEETISMLRNKLKMECNG
jgi:ribulose-phosphate 3-epimerase